MEKLAGRLRCEHTPNGIRLEIPAQSSWEDAFILIFLIAWTSLAILYRRAILPGDQASPFAWFNLAFSIAGVLLVVGLLLWSLTGRTILHVSPFEIRLERRVVGLEWDTRAFRVDQVHGLRFIPPYSLYKYVMDTDRHPSKMEFVANNKRYRFARGITEREACALINRVNSIADLVRTDDGVAGSHLSR
jgi:hypothetical protein